MNSFLTVDRSPMRKINNRVVDMENKMITPIKFYLDNKCATKTMDNNS